MPRHVLFLRLAYQAGMCLLALVAVTLTAIDLTTEAAEWEVTADRTIYWIFVLDYVIRFSISRSKWLFVKEHPWDLLAIIPFDALFRLFRFASLGEILRLARYLDLFSYAMRFTTRIRRFFNTNGFKYICIAALVIIRLWKIYSFKCNGRIFKTDIRRNQNRKSDCSETFHEICHHFSKLWIASMENGTKERRTGT